jgi:diadenylate cyclase
MSSPGHVADALHAALAAVAPGTPLRDGLDRVVRAKMGALVVVGDGPEVLAICSGGFLLDSPYSPQRLSELAKMDGAIILNSDATRIARANVHLVPDPTVPTSETGTRHRTAERVARSLDVPVISVSEEMGVINVYAGGAKHQLQDISRLLDRANQALQTLERYKARLDDALSALTANELEDVATVRDVAAVMQRGEMVFRIANELETMIVELGVDARLLRLQLDEVYGEIDDEIDLVAADYPDITATGAGSGTGSALDDPAAPRGLRLLARVARVTPTLAAAVVDRFGELARLQRATIDELAAIDGVDHDLAESIKDTLDRLTETSILDQYS